MSDEEFTRWLVEQAVYLQAHEPDTIWKLSGQVEQIYKALQRAEELVTDPPKEGSHE